MYVTIPTAFDAAAGVRAALRHLGLPTTVLGHGGLLLPISADAETASTLQSVKDLPELMKGVMSGAVRLGDDVTRWMKEHNVTWDDIVTAATLLMTIYRYARTAASVAAVAADDEPSVMAVRQAYDAMEDAPPVLEDREWRQIYSALCYDRPWKSHPGVRRGVRSSHGTNRGWRALPSRGSAPFTELQDEVARAADGPVFDALLTDAFLLDSNRRSSGVDKCSMCTIERTGNFWTRDEARMPEGLLYESRLMRVSARPLRAGIYGQTNISRLPFEVTVNSNAASGRREIALVHELVHVMDQLYKLNLSHDQVHSIGVFLSAEAIPVLEEYRRRQNT